MAKDRADKAEFDRRVQLVLAARLDGAQLHDLVAFAAQQVPPWGVSERQLARYLDAADGLLAQRMERKRGRLIGLHVARREALYARAVNAADYGTALRVLADLAKLQNLYATDKDLKELVKLATAQADRLRELEGRLDAAGGLHATGPGPQSDPPHHPPA